VTNTTDMASHMMNTTDMDFTRENIKRVGLRECPYVCIRGQSSIYDNSKYHSTYNLVTKGVITRLDGHFNVIDSKCKSTP